MGRSLLVLAYATLLAVILDPSISQGQTSQAHNSTWEIAAGGKMSFEVASIKQDTAGIPFPPKFPISEDDSYSGNTTIFTSGFPLSIDIAFAYKLPADEEEKLQSKLPKWAQTQIFDIEAQAAVPSTKDQMRLMMQSLLEERFKLKVHFETKEMPVFALVLAKSGKTGPRLRPYADDPPCTDTLQRPLKMTAGELPRVCHGLMLFPSNVNGVDVFTWGSRDVSTRQIADDMAAAPTANLDRPVVDQTGLTGDFDFAMTFAARPTSVTNDATQADSAPTFLEALKDQLGLKLESKTAPLSTLMIDHIEEPSPN